MKEQDARLFLERSKPKVSNILISSTNSYSELRHIWSDVHITNLSEIKALKNKLNKPDGHKRNYNFIFYHKIKRQHKKHFMQLPDQAVQKIPVHGGEVMVNSSRSFPA